MENKYCIHELLKNQKFKKYRDSLGKGPEFDRYARKARFLDKVWPEDFTVDQVVDSLLLNLHQDYDSIITDLPSEFSARDCESSIHVGNTNQIGIFYTGKLSKEVEVSDYRMACLSVHFRDNGEKGMYIENIQGEIPEENFDRRGVRRIFGKLNSHFGEDWRVGLLRQTADYARAKDIKVKGKVPGVFAFIGHSISEYPMYSINYVRTYLQIGIDLEDIEFARLWEGLHSWDAAVKSLKTKSPEERIERLSSAANEYGKSYRRLWRECYNESKLNLDEFYEQSQEECKRIFAEYLE